VVAAAEVLAAGRVVVVEPPFRSPVAERNSAPMAIV
jgi:hypothetical protein